MPVLLVEGGRDPFLPGAEHVHRLAAARACETGEVAAGKGCVESVRIAGANHNSLVHRHWPKLDRAIEKFLREVQTAAETAGVSGGAETPTDATAGDDFQT